MKVAIVGSRDFDQQPFEQKNMHTMGLGRLIESLVLSMDNEDYVVSGGASGADRWGEYYARSNNRGRIIHAAHWDKHGKAAGHIRNALIVKDADIFFAFFTNRATSRGTLNCVSQARKKGIPVYEFDSLTSMWYLNGEAVYVVIEAMYASILKSRRTVIESNARPGVGVCPDQSHGDLCDSRHDHARREELSHSTTQPNR